MTEASCRNIKAACDLYVCTLGMAAFKLRKLEPRAVRGTYRGLSKQYPVKIKLVETKPAEQNVPCGTYPVFSKRIHAYRVFHVEHQTHFAQKSEPLT